jgi:hypothetical protein
VSDFVLAALWVRLDAQAESLNVMQAAITGLVAELKLANDIHTRTLEGLAAAIRGDDDQWWKHDHNNN